MPLVEQELPTVPKHLNSPTVLSGVRVPWSIVTKIFQSGQPSHGGGGKIFEMMTSILPKGTLGS
jgi:hypothetical protein